MVRGRGSTPGTIRRPRPSAQPSVETTPPAVLALFEKRESAVVKTVQKGVHRIRDWDGLAGLLAHDRQDATLDRDDHVPADVQVTVDVPDDRVAKGSVAAPCGNPVRSKYGSNLASGFPECRQKWWDRVGHQEGWDLVGDQAGRGRVSHCTSPSIVGQGDADEPVPPSAAVPSLRRAQRLNGGTPEDTRRRGRSATDIYDGASFAPSSPA